MKVPVKVPDKETGAEMVLDVGKDLELVPVIDLETDMDTEQI